MKSEFQLQKSERSPKAQARKASGCDGALIRISDFGLLSSFVIRHSSFPFPAPTGRHSIAQGEALGSSEKHFSSPERARLRPTGCSALSGLQSVWAINPGLCPGLSNDGLSGLSDSERRFPNRRGAERSAGFSPLHRADDEGFRKNPCAGKWRGVKRPEGRAPGAPQNRRARHHPFP